MPHCMLICVPDMAILNWPLSASWIFCSRSTPFFAPYPQTATALMQQHTHESPHKRKRETNKWVFHKILLRRRVLLFLWSGWFRQTRPRLWETPILHAGCPKWVRMSNLGLSQTRPRTRRKLLIGLWLWQTVHVGVGENENGGRKRSRPLGCIGL